MSDDDAKARAAAEPASAGVLAGAPADLFENFSGDERALIADAAPFRSRPMPIGGSRKGRPNKRTIEMRDLYLRSGFPHPLLWYGAMLREGVDGLAGALDCSLAEAADLLRKIAADALPYLESRMPTKVTAGDGERLPVLIVGDFAQARDQAAAARRDGAMAIDDDLDEQIQRLSAGEGDRSHGDGSHDAAQGVEDAGVSGPKTAD